jgi:hypothetical protein
MMSFIPMIQFISFGTRVVYPLRKSYEALFPKAGVEVDDLMQWLMYWCIFAVFQLLDTQVIVYVAEFIPLYEEAKWLLFLWLVHPATLGARFTWAQVDKLYAPISYQIFEVVHKYCPPAPVKKDSTPAKKKDSTPAKEEAEPAKPAARVSEPVVSEPVEPVSAPPGKASSGESFGEPESSTSANEDETTGGAAATGEEEN